MERGIIAIFNEQHVYLINGRFLELKIWNPLVYVADRLKKVSGSGQLYIVNVKIVHISKEIFIVGD